MKNQCHEFRAVKHRYADGVKYDQGRYDLLVNVGTETDPYYRGMGGMRICKGKVIAFVGATSLSDKVKTIINYADHYVWGDTISDALAKIKPFLVEEKKRRS